MKGGLAVSTGVEVIAPPGAVFSELAVHQLSIVCDPLAVAYHLPIESDAGMPRWPQEVERWHRAVRGLLDVQFGGPAYDFAPYESYSVALAFRLRVEAPDSQQALTSFTRPILDVLRGVYYGSIAEIVEFRIEKSLVEGADAEHFFDRPGITVTVVAHH